MKLLNKDTILALLDHKTIKMTIVDTIDSTNNAFDACTPCENIFACLAETQTQGRGQFQRVWHSPYAENIYLSLCYFSSKSITQLSSLSLVVGYALCATINTLLPNEKSALIKWPNDILCNGAKLSGVLIETKKISNVFHRVIIGIGLNVNMPPGVECPISQPWTSLIQLTGVEHDRNSLCAQLINQTLTGVQLFEQQGFAPFALKWNHYNALLNKPLKINHNNQITLGKCIDISLQGELILELPTGERKMFASGEVSLNEYKK